MEKDLIKNIEETNHFGQTRMRRTLIGVMVGAIREKITKKRLKKYIEDERKPEDLNIPE